MDRNNEAKRTKDQVYLDKIQQEENIGQQELMLYERILYTVAQWTTGESRTKAQVWGAVANQTNPLPVPSRKKFVWYSAAASIVGLLLAIYMFADTQTVLTVPQGHTSQTFDLPDGSTVVANAGSTITFDNLSWASGNRNLTLDGLANFQVRKGSKFQVKTGHGTVEVLGTSFNVKAYENEFVVECLTGKVKVSSLDENSVVLTPGLKTELINASLVQPKNFNPQKSSQWLEGKFYFYNATISEVMQELENQFAVKVQADVDRNARYTGSFDNADIQVALEMICKPMNYKFTIDDNTSSVVIWNFNSIN